SVAHRQGLVHAVRETVETLHAEGLRRRRAVVVDLLEDDLLRRIVHVVLVRRIARPVPRRGEHLDDEDPLRGKAGLDHVVDLPRRVAGAAHLDRDLAGALQHRLEPPLDRAARDRELRVAFDPVLGVPRQVERPRQLLEHPRPRPELEPLPVGFDAAPPFEQHDRGLLAARVTRIRAAETLDGERQATPPGRLRRHPLPLPRSQQEGHAGSTSTLTARPARSSCTAAGSSSRPMRWVTSGARSSRCCSSSRIASGNTSWPTKLPRIVTSPRVIRSCAISARACVFTPKRRMRPPLATRSSAAGSCDPTASTTTSAGAPSWAPGAITRAPRRSASAARSAAGSTATTLAPACERSATNISPIGPAPITTASSPGKTAA